MQEKSVTGLEVICLSETEFEGVNDHGVYFHIELKGGEAILDLFDNSPEAKDQLDQGYICSESYKNWVEAASAAKSFQIKECSSSIKFKEVTATPESIKLKCSRCEGTGVIKILVSDDEDGEQYAAHYCGQCCGKGFNILKINKEESKAHLAEIAPTQYSFVAECLIDVKRFVDKLKETTSKIVVYHMEPEYLNYEGKKVQIPNLSVHLLSDLSIEELKAVAKKEVDCHAIEDTLTVVPLETMDIALRKKVFGTYLDQCTSLISTQLNDPLDIISEKDQKFYKNVIQVQIFVNKVIFER